MKKITKKIKAAMSAKPDDSPIPPQDFVGTGLTELNLACSGRSKGGIPKGFYLLVVGDSSTGKSWIAMNVLAEAANTPAFDDYQLVYDNAEKGSLPNVRKFFGAKLADRIRPPKGTWDEPEDSASLEEFYDTASDIMKDGPCIYITDSMDALVPQEEEEAFDKDKEARKKGGKSKGTYGTSKPKENSRKLRVLVGRMKKTKSILIIISQTRQNIGFGAMFNPKTRSGGDALKFYCRLEWWLSNLGKIYSDPVNGKKRQIGQRTKVKIVKNHINGWVGEVVMPIYRSYGVDHVGASINYLIREKVFKGSEDKGKMVNTKGLLGVKKTVSKEKLVEHVAANGLEDELRKLVTKTWKDVEAKTTIKRKPRYE